MLFARSSESILHFSIFCCCRVVRPPRAFALIKEYADADVPYQRTTSVVKTNERRNDDLVHDGMRKGIKRRRKYINNLRHGATAFRFRRRTLLHICIQLCQASNAFSVNTREDPFIFVSSPKQNQTAARLHSL